MHVVHFSYDRSRLAASLISRMIKTKVHTVRQPDRYRRMCSKWCSTQMRTGLGIRNELRNGFGLPFG